MKKPILVFEKNADKATNKIIIPKFLIEQWGSSYYMEVYEDQIVLKPIRKEQ